MSKGHLPLVVEQALRNSGADGYVQWYFGYQYRLGVEYLVPLLASQGARIAGGRVLEIGCAEGGVLTAFAHAGATQCHGTDIAEWRLATADTIAGHLGTPCSFSTHDIVTSEPPEEFRGAFDIVILRDVLEHLLDPEAGMKHAAQALKPGGLLYIVFPPYHSPFGGHQHTLKNVAGKFPFVHLLPRPLWNLVLRGGRRADIEEVERLRTIRVTISKVKRFAKRLGLGIVREDVYLLRPVFKVKFGIPPVGINMLRGVPGLRELICTEASVILRVEPHG
jgi:SAM-dependent methyltransferase